LVKAVEGKYLGGVGGLFAVCLRRFVARRVASGVPFAQGRCGRASRRAEPRPGLSHATPPARNASRAAAGQAPQASTTDKPPAGKPQNTKHAAIPLYFNNIPRKPRPKKDDER
jgi:hypothetical protein